MAAKKKEPLPVVSGQPEATVVQEIALELLDASAKNPRRTMDEADLKELAASIREQGITNPLLVRVRRSVYVQFEDHSSEEIGPASMAECSELLLRPGAVETEVDDRYEIIAGHRRSEAATLAGLTLVPCIVRDLTDDPGLCCPAPQEDAARLPDLLRGRLPGRRAAGRRRGAASQGGREENVQEGQRLAMGITRGICRFCGVGENQVDGDKLRWMDYDHTCCSGYACAKQDANQKRAKPKPKPRKHDERFVGMGYGAVIEEMRREARRGRRRK